MAEVSYTQPSFKVEPIGTNVKPVPTMSLGDVVNAARGAQAYKTEGNRPNIGTAARTGTPAIARIFGTPREFSIKWPH
jgi:hypothetical protein